MPARRGISHSLGYARNAIRSGAHYLTQMANLGILEAIITSIVVAGLFVTMLYTLPESIRRLPRDDTVHILARTIAVFLASTLSVLPLFALIQDGYENTSTSKLIGYSRECIINARPFAPVLATYVLFLGPAVTNVISTLTAQAAKKTDTPGPTLEQWLTSWFTPVSLRTVLVAPLSEEWVFRGCVLPLYVMAGCSPWTAIPATCLIFALAHVHHYFEHVRQGATPSEAALRIGLQLSYTSLFGLYAGWAFWRVGSVWTTALAHAVCNAFGLPDLSFLNKRSPLFKFRFFLAAMYLLGIAGFVYMLYSSPQWGGRETFPCALAFGIPS